MVIGSIVGLIEVVLAYDLIARSPAVESGATATSGA